ncbi:hypothetical protein J6590_034929 [Homalodisca vitripennis]|nr:hypothetical protein J6590_034929 [Homalodisca vitripennis]
MVTLGVAIFTTPSSEYVIYISHVIFQCETEIAQLTQMKKQLRGNEENPAEGKVCGRYSLSRSGWKPGESRP